MLRLAEVAHSVYGIVECRLGEVDGTHHIVLHVVDEHLQQIESHVQEKKSTRHNPPNSSALRRGKSDSWAPDDVVRAPGRTCARGRELDCQWGCCGRAGSDL